MKVNVKWIDSAKKDIKDIKAHIKKTSIKYAKIQIQKIMDLVDTLEDEAYTYRGRVMPERPDETLRYLLEGKYRIIYRIIDTHEVHIMRVWHSSRPFNPDEQLNFDY